MRQAAFLLLLILLLCPLASASPPLVSDPEIPVCGDVNFFFWNDSSDYGVSYQRLATYPQLQDESIFRANVSSGTGPKTIATFITDEFTEGATMAPGLSRFRLFANVTSTSGITTVESIPYKVSKDGTETRLWFGESRTTDIDETSTTPTEYLKSYARRNYTYFEPGSRYMIRMNASTTVASARTISLEVAGTSQASMVSTGYWLCDEHGNPIDPTTTRAPPAIPNLPAPAYAQDIPWYVWVLILIVAYLVVRLIL